VSQSFTEPSVEALVKWGANFVPLTFGHAEVWRLVTSIFLHGNWLHILVNMYSLFAVGTILETFCGEKKYLLIYFLTGILASFASAAYSLIRIKPTISVGASGAVLGVYATLLTIMYVRKDIFIPKARRDMLRNGALFVGYNLFIGIMVPEIDNAAHVGGFLSGIVAGFLVAPSIRLQVQSLSSDS